MACLWGPLSLASPIARDGMSPTTLRARRIAAIGLPGAEEDALLGLSHHCATGLTCTTDAAGIRTLMGYGKYQGDLILIADALRSLERNGLIAAVPQAGSKHTCTYTLRPDQWR